MTAVQVETYTPEALEHQFEVLYQNFDRPIVIGSLGRAVAYNQLLGDPDFEFNARSQTPLVDGNAPRDIDLLSTEREAAKLGPYLVEPSVFDNPLVSIIREGEDWWCISELAGFAELVHPAVMEPLEGLTVFDIECTSLPPQTQVALFGLKGAMRVQDRMTRDLLGQVVSDCQGDLLPEEMYETFDVLRTLIANSTYGRVQAAYQRLAPDHLRHKLIPITKRIKYHLPVA